MAWLLIIMAPISMKALIIFVYIYTLCLRNGVFDIVRPELTSSSIGDRSPSHGPRLMDLRLDALVLPTSCTPTHTLM
jgi:hypothetical protein